MTEPPVSTVRPPRHTGLAIPASPQPAPAPPPPVPTILYSWRERHPGARFHYIRHHEEANNALKNLNGGVYGFDLEWKPTFRKGQRENPVSLVQIANHEVILLLQITAMREFPSQLRDFLVSPRFRKAGAGIQGDAKKLHQDWQVDIHNCVDLSLLARTVDNGMWKGRYTNPLGLARMIAVYENRQLLKGKITRSNWEAVLSEPQQLYAANDAHAGYVIYMRLMSMMPPLVPRPQDKYYAFGSVRGRLCDPSGSTWQPANPNYDPGPLPPPREPKLQRPRHKNANADQHHSTTSTIDQSSDTDSTLSPSQPSSSFLGGATQQRDVRELHENNSSAMHLQQHLSRMPAQNNSRYPRRPKKKPTPPWLLRAQGESKASSSKHAEQRRRESNNP